MILKIHLNMIFDLKTAHLIKNRLKFNSSAQKHKLQQIGRLILALSNLKIPSKPIVNSKMATNSKKRNETDALLTPLAAAEWKILANCEQRNHRGDSSR
jgi:hypothetical protein